jgi:hypothetical protein
MVPTHGSERLFGPRHEPPTRKAGVALRPAVSARKHGPNWWSAEQERGDPTRQTGGRTIQATGRRTERP